MKPNQKYRLTKWTAILMGIILMIPYAYAASLEKKAEKQFKKILGKNIIITKISFQIPRDVKTELEKKVKQPFFRDSLTAWKIVSNTPGPADNQASLQTYAVMDNVTGKVQPMTFIVLFSPDGTVTAARIIKYREEHGYAVKNKSWLKQFKNKNSTSSFILGKDIDAVSGATISSRSMTKGIEKLSHLIHQIIKEFN